MPPQNSTAVTHMTSTLARTSSIPLCSSFNTRLPAITKQEGPNYERKKDSTT